MGDSAPDVGGNAPRKKSPRWWRWGWPLLLLGLAAAIPLLVWLGWSAISSSSDGTEVGAPVDPSVPGYRAFVEPTPTLLLIHAEGDHLFGVTLLALTDPGVEGGVLFIPPEMMASDGLLSERWVESGSAGIADSIAELLGVRTNETQAVADDGWAAMVAATAPVIVDNPDVLVTIPGEIGFDSGMLSLAAVDVGPYLGWRNPGESPLTAMSRQLLFWDAWLAQVAESTAPDVIPGEVDRGMGRFGRELAAGQVFMSTIVGQVDDNGAVVLNSAQTAKLVNEIIPFPISATGENLPRIRLLNGSGDFDLTQIAARVLSRAGAQITVVGNADEFGWETTKVAYHDTGFAPHAETYRDALGTGSVIAEEQPNASIDITVTFGADFSQLMAGGG
ncbi:MAG: LytR C-terminal domain-containing protein [bacterium]|nr:LytR C-terminal domain-containing protein [bacterium]MCY3633407.1 LytR C-terminal domain-containing protein [bacterium]